MSSPPYVRLRVLMENFMAVVQASSGENEGGDVCDWFRYEYNCGGVDCCNCPMHNQGSLVQDALDNVRGTPTPKGVSQDE